MLPCSGERREQAERGLLRTVKPRRGCMHSVDQSRVCRSGLIEGTPEAIGRSDCKAFGDNSVQKEDSMRTGALERRFLRDGDFDVIRALGDPL